MPAAPGAGFDRHDEMCAMARNIAQGVQDLTLHAWMEGLRDGLSHAAHMLTSLRVQLGDNGDAMLREILISLSTTLSLTALSVAVPTTTTTTEE